VKEAHKSYLNASTSSRVECCIYCQILHYFVRQLFKDSFCYKLCFLALPLMSSRNGRSDGRSKGRSFVAQLLFRTSLIHHAAAHVHDTTESTEDEPMSVSRLQKSVPPAQHSPSIAVIHAGAGTLLSKSWAGVHLVQFL
jgi:hypothetical protein